MCYFSIAEWRFVVDVVQKGRSKENVNFEEAKKEDHTGRGCIGGGNEAVDIFGKAVEVNKEGTLFQANTGSRRWDSQRSGERVE